MKVRVFTSLSHLIDGYVESGLQFSINFFWGEVTRQTASTQDTVKTTAAAHPLHTLLENCQKETMELTHLTLEPALGPMPTITAVNTPSDSGSRSSCSVSYRQAGPPNGSRGYRKVGAKLTTQLDVSRATGNKTQTYRDLHTLLSVNYCMLYKRLWG